MNKIKVKVKKLNELAVIPKYAHIGDAGMDLTATTKCYDDDGNIVYGTGLAFEVPQGYVGLLFPRSSNAKKDLILSNSVGVLDCSYRGEVMFKFKPSINNNAFDESEYSSMACLDLAAMCDEYNIGNRIGQIIIIPFPEVEIEESTELSTTDRGIGGYGSTGN